MLWLVGTTRIVRVENSQIPSALHPYLELTSPEHGDIFGEFDVCRLEPDISGQMRSACVADGRSHING